MKFKPALAIDATKELDNIKFPKYVSLKLDGIRCIFHPKLGMVSRALKLIPNKQLQEKFKVLTEDARKTGLIRDGELYAHKLTFQEITRACMTQDFYEEKTQKKLLKEFGDKISVNNYITSLINKIEFCCFDTVDPDLPEMQLENRMSYNVPEGSSIDFVGQNLMYSKEEILRYFKTALDLGYEGLILRDPKSPYKFGRSTLKEEYMLKVKPFETFDTKIIGVIQSTEVDPTAEKKTNELGRSVTSRKKDDRVLIEKAAAFEVSYNGFPLKVSIAATDVEKREIWLNKDSYIGRMIEYKGLMIGAKDVPRHPVLVRFRDDRNE